MSNITAGNQQQVQAVIDAELIALIIHHLSGVREDFSLSVIEEGLCLYSEHIEIDLIFILSNQQVQAVINAELIAFIIHHLSWIREDFFSFSVIKEGLCHGEIGLSCQISYQPVYI